MNMHSARRAMIGTVLTLAAAPVVSMAQEDRGGPWSIEIRALDSDTAGSVSGFSVDDEQTGTALGLGYAFNRFLAVQTTLADHGDHFAVDCLAGPTCPTPRFDEVDLRTLSVSLVASWPVTETVEIYGRVGVAAWNADLTRFAGDQTGRDLVYGGGVGAWVTPSWRVSLQYEKVDDLELESLGVGLAFRF